MSDGFISRPRFKLVHSRPFIPQLNVFSSVYSTLSSFVSILVGLYIFKRTIQIVFFNYLTVMYFTLVIFFLIPTFGHRIPRRCYRLILQAFFIIVTLKYGPQNSSQMLSFNLCPFLSIILLKYEIFFVTKIFILE